MGENYKAVQNKHIHGDPVTLDTRLIAIYTGIYGLYLGKILIWMKLLKRDMNKGLLFYG
jgi:hypothetical protein